LGKPVNIAKYSKTIGLKKQNIAKLLGKTVDIAKHSTRSTTIGQTCKCSKMQ